MVYDFERNKIRQQEVEVKALIALVNQQVVISMRIDAVRKLHEIAFPDILAEKINQEKLEYQWFVNVAKDPFQIMQGIEHLTADTVMELC